MLNIVVCANDGVIASKDIDAINTALTNYNLDYNIYKYISCGKKFDNFIRNTLSRKIYVIDWNSDFLDIVTKIRKYDWNSLILVITDFDKYKDKILKTKIMALDYIDKCFSYGKKLMDDIRLAISIINDERVFSFKYNGIIWRIPVNEICYIEKENAVKRCIIHTFDEKYYISSSISFLLKELKGNFYQTHQSCIVNLNNIKTIELNSNTIVFNNDERITLLTSKRKNEIKKCLGIDK